VIASFSAIGAIRHQVRGSLRYRSWDRTSSGSLLLSSTGRVTSQASTPGGNTYSQTHVWLNGIPAIFKISMYGTAMARNVASWPTGRGIGSRKSYSL
jgi:hypothetical protein